MSKLLVGGSPQPPIIQGVAPPARLEVSDFVKNEKHFSLYTQALRKLVVLFDSGLAYDTLYPL